MSIVTIPEELRVLLANLTERVELRDPAGAVLGTFTPQKVAEDEMYAEVIKSFDLEKAGRDLEAFLASGEKGYTIEEIIAELEEEEKNECRSE